MACRGAWGAVSHALESKSLRRRLGGEAARPGACCGRHEVSPAAAAQASPSRGDWRAWAPRSLARAAMGTQSAARLLRRGRPGLVLTREQPCLMGATRAVCQAVRSPPLARRLASSWPEPCGARRRAPQGQALNCEPMPRCEPLTGLVCGSRGAACGSRAGERIPGTAAQFRPARRPQGQEGRETRARARAMLHLR